MGKPLALVVRVSNVKGRDKAGDKFISPELQIAAASGYASGRGFEVLVIEPHDLNVSHTTPLDARPAMARALELVEAGKLAGIVVSSQDRLGPLDVTRQLKARLLAAQAVLLVPDNPAIEVLAAKGFAKLPGEQMALMHEAQREEIGLRWHKARRSAVEYGIHPSALTPVGYRRNDKEPKLSGRTERATLTAEERWADPVKRQLVPNEYAEAIRALFNLRAAGGSWLECCELLEAAGVPNSKGEPVWLHSSVQAVIRNAVYKGWAFLRSRGRQSEDIVNPEAHEPIVDSALWKAAQPKRGKPRRSSDGSLLSGVLQCASCGRKLTPSVSNTHSYYRCRPRMVLGSACNAPANVNAAEVEALVTRDFLGAVAFRPAAPTPVDLAPLEQAVALAKAKEAEWQAAAIAGESPEVALPAHAAAKERREAAEEELQAAREAAGLDNERLTLAERWEDMTIPERRRAFQAFGAKVLVQRGREPVAERVFLTFETAGFTARGFEPEVKLAGLPAGEGTVWADEQAKRRTSSSEAFSRTAVHPRTSPHSSGGKSGTSRSRSDP